jgi:hypothetical protein
LIVAISSHHLFKLDSRGKSFLSRVRIQWRIWGKNGESVEVNDLSDIIFREGYWCSGIYKNWSKNMRLLKKLFLHQENGDWQIWISQLDHHVLCVE